VYPTPYSSERTRAICDEEVVAVMVADASRDALVILEANRDTLGRAFEVLEREDLDRVDVAEVVAVGKVVGDRIVRRWAPLEARSLGAVRG
jgi:ATP-dependent Zn protease